MSAKFPFAAIVGQDALLEALRWLAVDPAIGGVLVTGTRGTAKSTAVRALAEVLPPIEVAAGDPFNRAPRSSGDAIVTIPTPFVELPVGATEDRVTGTLDVGALLASGERRFEPGLLARANRGILYVDEVNLLPDHLIDVVLDAAAAGTNVVERDGASFAHDARIMLVGTMNPEEGELRPQLLDRFGLCVAVDGEQDLARRTEVLRRRLAFDRDADTFAHAYAPSSSQLRAQIERGRDLVAHVRIGDEILEQAASLAIAARSEGLRGDLAIVRAARAIAALDGRTAVTGEDVVRAAGPALAHRRREPPRGGTPPPRPPAGPGSEPRDDERRSDERRDGSAAGSEERVFAIGTALDVEAAREAARSRTRRLAKRNPVRAGAARAVRNATARLAAVATLRAAALDRRDSDGGALAVERRHVRFVERRGRARTLVVFVVDASGSMAAAARMAAAKGVVCGLLEDAYHRRDAVALIAFRGERAELVVPPTRSAALAFRRLRDVPTGGRTPLAAALRRAREVAAAFRRRDAEARVSIVVVSDARANAPASGALAEALHEAELLRACEVETLCVDTEAGRIRLAQAARLARALEADYRHLEECSQRTLGAAVREWMAKAS